MWRRRITTVVLIAMLMLAIAPAAIASSGTMHCGSGGNPKTTKIGTPTYRTHYVQGYLEVYTNGTSVLWPYTIGSKYWSITPGTGAGACLI